MRGRVLTISSTFRHRPLSISSAYSNTIDDIALLGFVAQTPGFVRTRRSRSSMDDVQLAELY